MTRRPVLVRKKHKTKNTASKVNVTNVKLSSANDKSKKVSFFKPKSQSGDQTPLAKTMHTPTDKKSPDERVPVELFPLSGPGIEWYREKGINAVTNISRSNVQLDSLSDGSKLRYIALGSVKGKLKDNIDDLLQKLSNTGSDKQHLEAMVTIADHIVENGPIVETQHLVAIYKRIKGSTAKRISASQMLHTIGKHLNVAQIYINSKAYIFENPGKEMLDILKCLENINSIDENTIKSKLEDVIGDDFHVICEYMDSKRDRDTLKAILNQLTSSTFMAKLANVQDKRTFQRAKTQVTRNIQLFVDSHVVADPLCYRKISVCGFHVRKITFLIILRSLRNQEPIKTPDILQYGVHACCIILSFKFWFLVVHGVSFGLWRR